MLTVAALASPTYKQHPENETTPSPFFPAVNPSGSTPIKLPWMYRPLVDEDMIAIPPKRVTERPRTSLPPLGELNCRPLPPPWSEPSIQISITALVDPAAAVLAALPGCE